MADGAAGRVLGHLRASLEGVNVYAVSEPWADAYVGPGKLTLAAKSGNRVQ